METPEQNELQPYDEWAREQVEYRRRRAYSDPANGSDSLFVESLRLRAEGNTEKALEAEQKGISKAAEIKRKIPYKSLKPKRDNL